MHYYCTYMCFYQGGGTLLILSDKGRVWISVGDVNDLMGLLPKSAIMVSQRPPLWRSIRERGSFSVLLWRSCLRPDKEGYLPAMWPLVVNRPHMGQRRVGLCERRSRVLCTPPHEFLHVCELYIAELYVLFMEGEVRPGRNGAGEEGTILGGL
jgi:hypothetical protein